MSSPSVPAARSVSLTLLLDSLEPVLNYTWVGVACLVFFLVYTSTKPTRHYDGIPAVGRTGFFSSYLDAIRNIKHGKDFITEGYTKHKIFRIPSITRWHVLVAGPQLTDEVRKAPDDVLSFQAAIRDSLAIDWTLGSTISTNPYHVAIVRNQLTRNLSNLFPGLKEEITLAFEDIIPPTEDWTKVKAYTTMMKIIARTANRMFVGAPLCRDPEFSELSIDFTTHVVFGAMTIHMFPDILKPIVGRLFTNVPKSIQTALKYLKPIIDERTRKIEEFGPDYPDKPVDMLSWLMDEARGEERTPENIARRILTLNFASIHTTSMSGTAALFDLASRPEYIEPIRQEVTAVVAEHGWTKEAMSHMTKLDSFLKESLRMKGIGTMSMTRRALKEFTFSDGTRLTKGATVSVAAMPRHLDETVYPDAKTFNGFRFSESRGEGQATKNQMVSTSTDFLPFGYGRHACPGRYFAANELAAILAHIVLTYDIKMIDTPQDTYVESAIIPDRKAEVWFRKRRVYNSSDYGKGDDRSFAL